MPSFLTPVHESNDCHNPAGAGGGQFCSGEGGAAALTCEPGAKGQCFANANRWNARHGEADDRVVHGQVTNVEGKRFAHAWVERGDTVIDPTAGVVMPKGKFYELMDAKAEARYTSREAVRTQIRAGHHGPWTPEEQMKSIPESLADAGRAQAAHEQTRAAVLDAYPEGASLTLGRKTYTKQTVGGDTFWVGPKGGLSSRQFAMELGTRLVPHGAKTATVYAPSGPTVYDRKTRVAQTRRLRKRSY